MIVWYDERSILKAAAIVMLDSVQNGEKLQFEQ